MNHELGCAVCGRSVEANTSAFLLSVAPYTHWLRVQRWDKNLAQAAGTRSACHSAHAVEIAALWMATGSLRMTFAQSTPVVSLQPITSRLPVREPPPHFTRGGTGNLVGELAIDPSALQGTSRANIELQVSLLDALSEAMSGGERKLPSRPFTEGPRDSKGMDSIRCSSHKLCGVAGS